MRLIDVDKLIKSIDKEYPNIDRLDMKQIVENQPIVYNIDQIEEAQQKQVPKKLGGYNQGWCSVCGCCIDDSLYDNVKYCYQCGQAIDWSEEE